LTETRPTCETENRIGVYLCECGTNIKHSVRMQELSDCAESIEDVVIVRTCGTLCSPAGRELLAIDVREHSLSKVVIAACSPKEHEPTFRGVLDSAGLNSFSLQMANIREQIAWVVRNKVVATEKAKAAIRAAVKRVRHHEALATKQVDCRTDVLVLGAGVAGISAAVTLAQKNRTVYLVEKLPFIGGKAALYEGLFPSMKCASCLLAPYLDEVLHNDRIKILLDTELNEILGSYGNFSVRATRRARSVDHDACIGCGACSEACPVSVENQYNYGLNNRTAIYVPYAGALPNVPIVDRHSCLQFRGEECLLCQAACPFHAIDLSQEDDSVEFNVGAVVLATGFDLLDPAKFTQYGYGTVDNVLTSLEFERMLNSNGPTGGEILLRDGCPPRKLAIVHCVGSKTTARSGYCSAVCCAYSLKLAALAREKLPEASIVDISIDLCLSGKENLQLRDHFTADPKTQSLRLATPDSVDIRNADENIIVGYLDASGRPASFDCDMVVLAPAIKPSKDAAAVAELADIPQDSHGFFAPEDGIMAPVSTPRKGFHIAGCCAGPKDISNSVAQGQAAAGQILSSLIPGDKIDVEPMGAEVSPDLCSGCGLCVADCPFRALTLDPVSGHIGISEALCRGCGTCAATCPSSAIRAKHFTVEQISAEIEGLLDNTSADCLASVQRDSSYGIGRSRTRKTDNSQHLTSPAAGIPCNVICGPMSEEGVT
jgi:heterodisulfide reductase subunit A